MIKHYIIITVLLLILLGEMTYTSYFIWRRPLMVRADDGTPCYLYKNTMVCNFELSNRLTQFGEFPFAVEE